MMVNNAINKIKAGKAAREYRVRNAEPYFPKVFRKVYVTFE
jgi:hypothetical protein